MKWEKFKGALRPRLGESSWLHNMLICTPVWIGSSLSLPYMYNLTAQLILQYTVYISLTQIHLFSHLKQFIWHNLALINLWDLESFSNLHVKLKGKWKWLYPLKNNILIAFPMVVSAGAKPCEVGLLDSGLNNPTHRIGGKPLQTTAFSVVASCKLTSSSMYCKLQDEIDGIANNCVQSIMKVFIVCLKILIVNDNNLSSKIKPWQ